MTKAPKKTGRPSKRTAKIVEKVLAGLREGTPLTVICADDDMPCDDTIRRWAEKDEDLLRDIARARDAGHDRIAQDALEIADDASRDVVMKKGKDGKEYEGIDTEHIQRSKLRVETRLKLLAKWNPKRYGDRIDVTSGGEKIQREAGETEKFSRLAALMAEKREQGLLPAPDED